VVCRITHPNPSGGGAFSIHIVITVKSGMLRFRREDFFICIEISTKSGMLRFEEGIFFEMRDL
jgi:hypothetical protein